jgi:hypothetical protein
MKIITGTPISTTTSSPSPSSSPSPQQQRGVLKASAWKGLTFADFDKSPSKTNKNGSSSRPTGWMLLATAQHINLGETTIKNKEKKKHKNKQTSHTHKKGTTTSSEKTDQTKKKKSKPGSKKVTRHVVPQNAIGEISILACDTVLSVDKPVSTSELTATTATLSASERSEEYHPMQAVAALLPVVRKKKVVVAMKEMEAAVPKKRTIKKKKEAIPPSSEEIKSIAKSSRTTKYTVKSNSLSKKKRSKKTINTNPSDTTNTTTTTSTDVTTTKSQIEQRLKEIKKLEKLLKEERKAIQSYQASLSSDQQIMEYLIQQQVKRMDQLPLTNELQERVVRMQQQQQQQKLAVLQQDAIVPRKMKQHILELQAIIHKQATKIQRLRTELGDIDQDRKIDAQHILELQATIHKQAKKIQRLRTELGDIDQDRKIGDNDDDDKKLSETRNNQHKMEQKKFQEIINSKDATIATLLKEVKTLKMTLNQAGTLKTGPFNTCAPIGHSSTEGDVARPEYVFVTPDAPKPTKKRRKKGLDKKGMNQTRIQPSA